MPLPDIPKPRVKFILRGIVALFAEEKAQQFAAGIVNTLTDGPVEKHKPKIEITWNIPGSPNRTEKFDSGVFQLNLSPNGSPAASAPGVVFFLPELVAGDQLSRQDLYTSFSWALDINKEVLPGKKRTPNDTSPNPSALRTQLKVLGVEHAIFYTSEHTNIPFSSGSSTKLTTAALEVTALASLPSGEATLEILNDRGEIQSTLLLTGSDEYTFEVSNACSPGKCKDETIVKKVNEAYNDLILFPKLIDPATPPNLALVDPPIFFSDQSSAGESTGDASCPAAFYRKLSIS